MLRGLAVYLGLIGLVFLYVVMCRKISEVRPTLARYLQTPLFAAFYGLIGSIIAAIFVGPHVALYLFAPIALLSLRKAWNDTRPDDPTKPTGNFLDWLTTAVLSQLQEPLGALRFNGWLVSCQFPRGH